MPANWMDHAIATVAPRMAARRVMARQAFETLTRGYDGASKGRRTDGWRAPGSSADTEIGVAGALLRDRMRDLVRNNPHAAKAVAVLVVLNGTTEVRGSLGEISATHVSLATAIWLQTMVPLTAGDTVELQGYFRVADGYFAADHTSFWGCKIG